MKKMTLLLILFLMVGCAGHKMTSRFNPEHYKKYDGTGTASISGQAFLRTRGGEVRYAAGRDIVLFPDTPYVREMMQHADYIDVATVDARLMPYLKQTIGDGNGNFFFTNLIAGSYYLFTEIKWRVRRYRYTGGNVIMRINLADGESKRVILTR